MPVTPADLEAIKQAIIGAINSAAGTASLDSPLEKVPPFLCFLCFLWCLCFADA